MVHEGLSVEASTSCIQTYDRSPAWAVLISGPGNQVSASVPGLAALESHAQFAAGGSRDPVGLLLEQARSRVPELVPVRHGRMLVSPFTLYRGAALPMAADLAGRRDLRPVIASAWVVSDSTATVIGAMIVAAGLNGLDVRVSLVTASYKPLPG